MGITIIVKETKREQHGRIYERSGRAQPFNLPVAGVTRSVDEAHDIAYHRHGEPHEAFLVEGNVPEVQQAAYDNARRVLQQGGSKQDPADVVKQWTQEQ